MQEANVRLGTLLALTTGAAAGAGATYLFDPDLGHERRRIARRTALRRLGTVARRAARRTGRQARNAATAVVAGFEQGRQTGPTTGFEREQAARRRAVHGR